MQCVPVETMTKYRKWENMLKNCSQVEPRINSDQTSIYDRPRWVDQSVDAHAFIIDLLSTSYLRIFGFHERNTDPVKAARYKPTLVEYKGSTADRMGR